MDALLEEATQAIRSSYDECRAASGDDTLIGYAVYCDDSATDIAAIAASSGGVAGFDEGSHDDFVFNPEHWNVQHGLDQLSAASDAVFAAYQASHDDAADPDSHQRHRNMVFELMVGALAQLEREGYFGVGEARQDVFVIAWVMDSDVPSDRASGWSETLNPPAVHHRFVDWLASTDYWGPRRERPAKKAPAKKAPAKKQPPRRR